MATARHLREVLEGYVFNYDGLAIAGATVAAEGGQIDHFRS